MTIEKEHQEYDFAYSLREEMGTCMSIDIWYEGDVWVFRPFGRIDAGHSTDLDAALSEGVEQGMSLIVIDLTDVTYIASSGLRVIIKTAKLVKSDGGSVRICGMNDPVMDVFRLSGLSKIFPNYPSSQEAIQALQRRI